VHKKILINVPSLRLPGGVANHYLGLEPFWKCKVKYNEVGRRYGIPGVFFILYDYIRFFIIINIFHYDVVVINPSLGWAAVLRDAIFLGLAKLSRRPIVVYFHGWDAGMQAAIDRRPHYFSFVFGRANAFIVLAKEFSDKLKFWGIKSKVYLSSTKVDDRLISGFDIDNKVFSGTVLFLARIEKKKGVILALEAFSRVVENNSAARFVVAGSGESLAAAEAMVKEKCIPNVEFLGAVSGDQLIEAFVSSDIYLLPTTHGEGMPTSVLEAMAFGLPVITRPVGGLKDFFLDGEMGFISESLDPIWYADCIEKLMSNPGLIKRISKYNHRYAREHFLASKVASHIEAILDGV
jgi:glycosyltransferase involved in cell wall biosynthesis